MLSTIVKFKKIMNSILGYCIIGYSGWKNVLPADIGNTLRYIYLKLLTKILFLLYSKYSMTNKSQYSLLQAYHIFIIVIIIS